MAHFGVTETDLKKVMAAALEKGGDYVDLYFEHTFNNSVSLMDGTVNRCASNIDFGMGVRVLAGDQTGYAYVEGITLDEMLRAARTAARIASSGQKVSPVGLTEKTIGKNRYAVVTPWEEADIKVKIPYLERINEKIFSLDNRVRKVQASLVDCTSHVLFCNSEGVSYYDYRPMVSFMAFCIMEENGRMENSYSTRSYRKGVEFLTDDIVDIIAREAVENTVQKQENTKAIPQHRGTAFLHILGREHSSLSPGRRPAARSGQQPRCTEGHRLATTRAFHLFQR